MRRDHEQWDYDRDNGMLDSLPLKLQYAYNKRWRWRERERAIRVYSWDMNLIFCGLPFGNVATMEAMAHCQHSRRRKLQGLLVL